MAQPHVYRTEAIVLRQRALVDADKVCVLFTPLHGRIEAVAKGVRRPRSRLAGHLEPLTRSRLLVAKTRSLDIITQAETVEAFPALHADLDRLSRALYVAELVDRFTDTATDVGALYRLLLDTLHRLETTENPDLPVRWFEMRLLDDQGYRPQLQRCVRCDTTLQPEGNAFSAPAGGVVCPDCRTGLIGRPLSGRAFKLLRFLQSAAYDKVAQVRVDASLGRETEGHLRSAVELALDQEIRAARFVEVVRTTPQQPPRRRPQAEDLSQRASIPAGPTAGPPSGRDAGIHPADAGARAEGDD